MNKTKSDPKMWYLTSENDARVIYVSPTSGEIVIGRKTDDQTCNFDIQDDPSISRKHAALSAAADGNINIQDLGSRYGTFVNNARLDGTSKLLLDNNDKVKFGKMGSVWKVNKIEFVTCTSTLRGENLQTLKQCLSKLGGSLKSDWDDSCVYLTMPAITLTIKVVLALVQGAHIVHINFWTKCLEAFNNNIPLPNPKDYIPQIIESTLNKETVSFLPNSARKNLFEGKKIIFFSKKQLDMYKTVLEKSSGTPILISSVNMTKAMLSNKNVIVIQYNQAGNQESEQQRNQFNEIVSYLTGKGKRVVADPEIGLAILFCSLNKYCNPGFNFSSEVIKQSSEPNKKQANVLAPETQDSQNSNVKKENVIIDESLVSKNDDLSKSDVLDNSGFKRKLDSDLEIEGNANKKQATGIKVTELNKRKYVDDNNFENPNKKMTKDSNMDDEMFNFDTSNDKQPINNEKKLNLAKPVKRKIQDAEDDDDLFNFVEDKKLKATNNGNENSNILQTETEDQGDSKDDNKYANSQRCKAIETVDVVALRGIKLKELQQNTLLQNAGNFVKKEIKKESNEDLDEKMGNLDLGTTIVTIKKDLVVKKEPLEVTEPVVGQVKNFKKFKKVWPIKMQVTIIPKSSMNITPSNSELTVNNSMSYTQNE